jgi:hypothetical protein
MELTGLSYPEEYGGAGVNQVTPGHRGRGSWPADRSQLDLPDLEAAMLVLNFQVRRAQGHSALHRAGESQGSYCLSGRRRVGRRL